MLRTRILVIISVGISVGFLLGMGVSALLRAMVAGGDRGLEMTFTALVVLMAGILITYGLKSISDSQMAMAPWSEIHMRGPQSPSTELDETTTVPIAVEENGVLHGLQADLEARVNGKETPVAPVPVGGEPVIDYPASSNRSDSGGCDQSSPVPAMATVRSGLARQAS